MQGIKGLRSAGVRSMSLAASELRISNRPYADIEIAEIVISLRGLLRQRARLIGLAFVFLWFLIGGIAHFVATDTEMRIVPPYIPYPRAVVIVSGVFELLGAAGLLYPPMRRAAGAGLVALTIAVTPAHIYMLQRPDLFDVPYWALVLRLPIQVALLLLIAWSTRSRDTGSRCSKLP
jgi:uncharacterized membrane protein